MHLPSFLRRLGFIFHRQRHRDDLDEEMRLHVDLRARTLESHGISPPIARRAAEQQFGSRTSIKETALDMWSFIWIENVWRDLTYGARVLRNSPNFTAMAVLTLALGIGSTTAILSVIDNVLLEPFPYADQQRLFSPVIHDASSSEPGGRTMFPQGELLDYEEQNHIFDDVMGVGINRSLWTTGGALESVNAPLVTGNAFQFLGVSPLLGRIATPSDIAPGSTPVCVMSYGFWKSRFAGDPRVIGRTLILDGTPRTVIGVMPPRFVFWSADVWLPMSLRRDNKLNPPWFYLLGRLRRGMTRGTAEQQLQIIAGRLAATYPPGLYPRRFTVTLRSFADAAVGKFRSTLYTLLAAVMLLLLIACANVASLLLVRVTVRNRELALRTSLGAGWWRIARQLFFEGGLIAFGGAAVGCGFAWAGLRLLITALPPDTFPDEAVIGLNLRVLMATVAVAAFTALFFGLVPLLGGLRSELNETLKSGTRQHSSVRSSRFRNLLIPAQVAISLVLLAGAGVMMRSFVHEVRVEPGIRSQDILTAEVFLTKSQRTPDQQAIFDGQLTAALQRLPGVLKVATTTDFVPFAGVTTSFEVPGTTQPSHSAGQLAMTSPALFGTLGVPLLLGRNLQDDDIAQRRLVAVVNESLAKRYFPRQNPVGKWIRVSMPPQPDEAIANPVVQIIGVAADFKNHGLREPVVPEAFLPYTLRGYGGFSVLVRTVADPQILGRALERTALTLDKSAVVRHIRTVEQALEAEEYARPRFGLEIFSVFGFIGILLVSTGLYAITAHTVSQRRREMGIRVALGATSASVHALVMRTGMRSVVVGVVAGLGLSFVLLRFIQAQIWGIGTDDPVTLIGVSLLLTFVGLVACFVPSLEATRIDPSETLRSE